MPPGISQAAWRITDMRPRTVTIEEVTFRDHGGPYIDVCLGDRAFDVINVWDYAAGKRREYGSLRLRARQWMRENAADYRRNGYGL
jgi:hypothetical protein